MSTNDHWCRTGGKTCATVRDQSESEVRPLFSWETCFRLWARLITGSTINLIVEAAERELAESHECGKFTQQEQRQQNE